MPTDGSLVLFGNPVFAQHFYWALAQGMPVGAAAREARIAVNYSLSRESIDWAVPVVYARDPNSRLSSERRRDVQTMPSPVVGASSRRSVAGHTVRIAVWDTHSQFPALRQTLDRMNRAQRFYGFEIVDLSVPLDAWHIHRKTRYLDADRFADRLAPQLSQLGVQYLSVIVNERMVCDTKTPSPTYDIYGWWPSPGKPPVLLFSTQGLGMEPKGPATDRGIGNVAVSGITGYLLDVDSHVRGPRNCPNYYNPDCDLSVLTSRQRFCKRCTKMFPKARAQEFKALNAILAAFD